MRRRGGKLCSGAKSRKRVLLVFCALFFVACRFFGSGRMMGVFDEDDFPGGVPVRQIAAVTLAVVAFSGVAASAADSKAMNGWISDSMCGAKHAGSGSECVKKCVQGGMTPGFVDEGKKQVWTIDNPDSVKKYYGDHVAVKATAAASKKSVHVASIDAAK